MGTETLIGFDSAWADNPKAPGAISALQFRDGELIHFEEPRLVGFTGALNFIREFHDTTGVTLLALDQPTIVINESSMRPVERVAASLVSWLGGGVQPSNTNRKGMFCSLSPIWPFLKELGATEDPIAARTASSGIHLIEVFPAIALPSFDSRFCGPKQGPRYNPDRRKTFRIEDWQAVTEVMATQFESLGISQAATTCVRAREIERPRKADQDKLDSLICLLIALHWRRRPAAENMMLGSLRDGYMVLPASETVRRRLEERADLVGVPYI